MTFSIVGTDTQTRQRVELPQSSRREGLYIIGGTGQGKTGLIENLIVQDINQGLGVCVLDPHSDLTNAVISRMPDKRVEDVVLLDITDYEHPFGVNLFTCSDPTNPEIVNKAMNKVMHIFKRLWGKGGIVVEDAWGVLLEEILRNATLTLLEYSQYAVYTMAEIPLLLEDADFRNKLVQKISNRYVKRYWLTKYNPLSDKDQREERRSTLNRVYAFLTQPLVENIVGQTTTTINFRRMMDERKIVLVRLDLQMEDVTSLIGSMIIAELLAAAYSRSDLEKNKRKQFNVYADEFQHFATPDFATLLTEARKFGIATTIAHQARYQPGMTDGIRATSLTASNLVVFNVSSKDAEELAGEYDCSPIPSGEKRREPLMQRATERTWRMSWNSTEAMEEYKAIESQFEKIGTYVETLGKLKGFPPFGLSLEEAKKRYPKNPYGFFPFDCLPHCKVHPFSDLDERFKFTRNLAYALRHEQVLDYLLQHIYIPSTDIPSMSMAMGFLEIAYLRNPRWETVHLPPIFPNNIELYLAKRATKAWPVDTQENREAATQVLEEVRPILATIKENLVYRFFDPAFVPADKMHWLLPSERPFERYLYPYLPDECIAEMETWINTRVEKCETQLYELRSRRIYLKDTFFDKKKVWYDRDLGFDIPVVDVISVDRYGNEQTQPRYKEIDILLESSQVKDRIANELTNQPKFIARVKITTDAGLEEYTVRTLPPEQGLGRTAFATRKAKIQAQNRDPKAGYCRPRQEVEEEISIRQEQCSGSPPQPPQRPSRDVEI